MMMKRLEKIIPAVILLAVTAAGLRVLQGTSPARLPDRYGQPAEPSRLLCSDLSAVIYYVYTCRQVYKKKQKV